MYMCIFMCLLYPQFGFWMWSDGSNFHYENWFNNVAVDRTEHCLMINYGCNKLHTQLNFKVQKTLKKHFIHCYLTYDNRTLTFIFFFVCEAWKCFSSIFHIADNMKWNYYACEETLPFVCAKTIWTQTWKTKTRHVIWWGRMTRP